jgi:glycosyltransferase involved in cell wall biosynthesis
MTTNIPRVSIGLPVYNGENFLRVTLTSLLAQRYRDFELIISDNGSTDATESICREFAARDSRVQYHRADRNRGAVWNYNRVVELARGEYFQWASHDDLWDERFLQACVEALDADASRVLALPQVGVVDQHHRLIVAEPSARRNVYEIMTDEVIPGRRANLESDVAAHRYYGVLVQTIRVQEIYGLIRMASLRRTPLMRSYANSEKVLLAELALMGKIHEVPERLYFSRWHDERYSNSHDAALKSEHFVTDDTESPADCDAAASKRRRKFIWPHQPRCLAGYASVVISSRLPFWQKAKCGVVLARFVLQVNRMGAVLKRMWRGTGMTVDIPPSATTGASVAEQTGLRALAPGT